MVFGWPTQRLAWCSNRTRFPAFRTWCQLAALGGAWAFSLPGLAQNPTAAATTAGQVVGTSAVEDHWSEFRGLNGTGRTGVTGIPIEWQTDSIAWSTPLPGRGWSSPVVAGELLWMTTAIETKSGERVVSLDLRALAVNRRDGKLVHDVSLFTVDRPPELHTRNSYASPTPAVAAGRVICSFGTMGTAALNADTGEVIWKHRDHQIEHETGPGSSPIVRGSQVFLHFDGTDQQFLVSLKLDTGELVWKTKRSGELHEVGMYQKAFSTPVLWESPAGPQLLSAGANWVYSYDPANGKELWKVSYGKLGFSNVPRPLVTADRMYVCTGYMKSSLLAFALSPQSDSPPALLWSVDRGGPTVPTPILVDDFIVMVSDDGIVSGVEVATGKQVWRERLKGAYAASPIEIDGWIWLFNDEGRVFVVRPSAEFVMQPVYDIQEPVMSTPAAVDRCLYVRTLTRLLAIPAKSANSPDSRE